MQAPPWQRCLFLLPAYIFRFRHFFLQDFAGFLLFWVYLSGLCCKKLHPMQFPQISVLCFPFYVNTIKSQKNPIFVIDFTGDLAYNRERADIGNIPAVHVNRGDKKC